MSDISPLSFTLGYKKYAISQNKGITTINIVHHDGDTTYYRITKGKDTRYDYDNSSGQKTKKTSADFLGYGYSGVEVSAVIELAEAKATMKCMLKNKFDSALADDRARLDNIMWNLRLTSEGIDYSE